MIPLPLANVLHHKLRSALSALGVGIAVAMLITLGGLTRGWLEEVASRWEAVDADLIVYPARFEDVTSFSGVGLPVADAAKVEALSVEGRPAVERVVSVFILAQKPIGAGKHNVVGVAPEDLEVLLGGRKIRPGGRV